MLNACVAPAAKDKQIKVLNEIAKKKTVVQRTADKYAPAQPPPKIDENLAALLKGKRAMLQSWIKQHRDDDISEILAAFSVAVDRINSRLGE